MRELSIKQKEIKKGDTFQNSRPSYSVVKPSDWNFIYLNEGELTITKKADDSGGAVQISVTPFPVRASLELAIAKFKKSLIEVGGLGLFSISKNIPADINNLSGNKLTFSIMGKSKSVYYFYAGNYLLELDYDYGRSDKDKAAVDKIINSLNSSEDVVSEQNTSYQSDKPLVSLVSNKEWPVIDFNSKNEKAQLYNSSMPNAFIDLDLSKIDSEEKDFSNEEKLKSEQDMFVAANNMASILGINMEMIDSSAHFRLNDEINDAVMEAVKINKVGTNELLMNVVKYSYRQGDYYINISFNMFTDSQTDFDAALEQVKPILTSLSLKPLSENPTALALAAKKAEEEKETEISAQTEQIEKSASAPSQSEMPTVTQEPKKTLKKSPFENPIFWVIAGVWLLVIILVVVLIVVNMRRR